MAAAKQHQLHHSFLLKAGPNLKPLLQIHAQIITTNSHSSLSILTKLLTLLISSKSITHTRRLFSTIPNPDSFLFNTLIKSSTKYRFPHHAIFFYNRMLRCSGVSVSSYTFTSVVKACADLCELRLGKGVHCHVLVSGYGADLFVQGALVSFYAKCGELGVARKVFDGMTEKTIVAWNSMISGYEQNGFANEAIGLFNRMRMLGVGSDSATFVSLLSACSQTGALGLGCWVHEYVMRNGIDVNVVLGTALINMYARCGDVSKARGVFEWMKERNVIAWTAMVMGYGMHGFGKQAIELFEGMKVHGPDPNYITFIAVLSACAHAGLVDDGRRLYACMRQDYGIKPGMEHHVCMVDMLGRAGFLLQAFHYIDEEITENPAPAVWTAMLGACKMHKNFDLGVQVAERLLASEPENPGHYVMLSNIYALAGKMDRVEMVRNVMIRKRLKKQVGYSTIEIDQMTYLFILGDKSHADTNEIYRYLDKLLMRCMEVGYVPSSESVMHELEGEEVDHALRYHSEKLAITFGLMKTNHGVPIRIVKNLRMCEDCHSAIKIISVVEKREIIVRDKLRFHHFKDGSCSCVDYW